MPYSVRELLATREANTDRPTSATLVATAGLGPLLEKRIDRISKGEWRLTVVTYAMIGAGCEHHWGEAWESEVSTFLQYALLIAAFVIKDRMTRP